MTDTAPLSQLAEELRNAPEEIPDGRNDDSGRPSDDARTNEGARPNDAEADPSCSDGGGERGRGRAHGTIFDGCPVIPLGVNGDACWYLDVRGQLRAVTKHDNQKILSLFGGRLALLAHHFPSYGKDGVPRRNAFDAQVTSSIMMAACDECGVWDPTGAVRGTGAWTDDDGNLVLHAGDEVLIGGQWMPPGVYQGKVYSAAPRTPRGDASTGRTDAAATIAELIETWNWRRPDVDAHLALGLICAQMLGGALSWRPVGWLTGDQATGKSSFQQLLSYLHGGETGLKQASDATEAGIRSVVGFSSLPVAIDEFEPDPENPRKTRAVIELARRAASGGQIFRGSSDQKGYQSNAYSCFLFSSILVPDMPSQDRSRLILLDLDRLPQGAPKPDLNPRRLRTLGARLRQRLIDGWPTWDARLDLWRAALARHEQTGRAADNYATVLAMADMAHSAELPQQDVLDNWAAKMARVIVEDSTEVGSNAEDMLTWLLSQYFDPYRRGEQFTVAQWVMAAAMLPGAPRQLFTDDLDARDKAKAANGHLAKIGLRVQGEREAAQLFLPNKPFSGLCRLFEGSAWENGVWAQAARRLTGAERTKALTLAGVASRGHYVPFTSIPGLLSFPMDRDGRDATTPARHDLPHDIDDLG